MNSEGSALSLDSVDPRDFAFGYGRRWAPKPQALFPLVILVNRICPGRYMAEATLWISIAVLLSVFDLSSAVDENGKPIDVKLEYDSNFIVRYDIVLYTRVS